MASPWETLWLGFLTAWDAKAFYDAMVGAKLTMTLRRSDGDDTLITATDISYGGARVLIKFRKAD